MLSASVYERINLKVLPGFGPKRREALVSLCDYSGNWPRPWHEAGHTVVLYDLKHGDDVIDLTETRIGFDVWNAVREISDAPVTIKGVLAAPVCTDFTISGAQYWPAKDADGRTAGSLRLLDACVRIGKHAQTWGAWWTFENPVGRIAKLRPELGKPRLYFHPYMYAHLADDLDAERYTKKTGLWGEFAAEPLVALQQENGGPIRVCEQGSWIQKLGGKSERTKELRSMTPMGFARAFYAAHTGGLTHTLGR